MAYTALYRKFRPQSFDEVKGQDHIVTTLKNELRTDRIGHAYLFTGTRGTGKTTVAKIFARAVNCENPAEDGSPCGECAQCRAAAAGSSMNVIEIDAASNNGVENIREIIDEVAYPPSSGKYKVYIIDEVHMLSAGAFNALLKTLEEPPSYVIFILATTEVHKIPITILSRCQRYDFRRISIDTIAARLSDLMKEEGTEVEEKALRYVAKAADGSMRDALSLLDQCIAFYIGQTLTYENVLEVLGAVDLEVFSRLFLCIAKKDAYGAVKLIEEIVIEGRELTQFVIDFTWYLRNLMLAKEIDDLSDILDMSSDNIEVLKEQAAMIEDAVIIRYIRIMSELSNKMKYSAQKRVLLEVAVIKLCRPQMEEDYGSLVDRISAVEDAVENGVVVAAQGGLAVGAGSGEAAGASGGMIKKPPEKRMIPKALPEEVEHVRQNWGAIVSELKEPMRSYVKKAVPTVNPEYKIELRFDTVDEVASIAYGVLSGPGKCDELDQVIEEKTGKHVDVVLVNNTSPVPSVKVVESFWDHLPSSVNVERAVEDDPD